MTRFDSDCADGWIVTRSELDSRVWVPYPSGHGDVWHMVNAGPLRKVKTYVEEAEHDSDSFEWRRLGVDQWLFTWGESGELQ